MGKTPKIERLLGPNPRPLALSACRIAMAKALPSDGRFYVYALIEHSGRARYIGKGTGDRRHDHAKLGADHYNRRLGEELAAGRLRSIKVADKLTEDAALALERSLTYWLGRTWEGGQLLNIARTRRKGWRPGMVA